MSDAQRKELLNLRKANRAPWHSPPHRTGDNTRFHITAACYEHKPIIGLTSDRMANFEDAIINLVSVAESNTLYAWAILPNHYHLLVRTEHILELVKELGRLHGRTSFLWNGEDTTRGRKVWCNALEHGIKSDRHFWATLSYIHHNPVRHGYVTRWQDWPFSSVSVYLNNVGREEARRVWQEYPVLDYGKEWDPPEI